MQQMVRQHRRERISLMAPRATTLGIASRTSRARQQHTIPRTQQACTFMLHTRYRARRAKF